MNLQPINFLQQPTALCLLVPLGLLIVFAIAAGAAFTHESEGNRRRVMKTQGVIEMTGVDGMTMFQFRDYVRKLMAHQGYETEVPAVVSADDIGTDLVATKDGRRTSVVIMRYSKVLSPRAVDEANRNKANYNCESAMVVTTKLLAGMELNAARLVANSDVLPKGSVAVAVTKRAVKVPGSSAMKFPLPLPSVVTLVEPR